MQNSMVLNIRLPQKLYDDAKNAAEQKNISLAAIVRIALSEYLERQK